MGLAMGHFTPGMVDDNTDRPDDVAAMMETLWGPRSEPRDPDPAASRRPSGRTPASPVAHSDVNEGPEGVGERPGQRDLDALRSHFDGARAEMADLVAGALEDLAAADTRLATTETLLSRLEHLEARVEQLQAAVDRQAATTEAPSPPPVK